MKRIFDLIVASSMLIFFLPIFLVVSLLVWLNLGSPLFFCQPRPGKNGKVFQLLKFRTMLNMVDSKGVILSDDKRLTIFGKLLRASSLDELPSLWNVIKGDMSLVGPRPLLVEYLPLYSSDQARRHEVRPGITGWAQVNGRNAISWEQKFKLDVWYVDNCSFWLDLKILLLTAKKVIIREGISSDGHVTTEKFKGSIK